MTALLHCDATAGLCHASSDNAYPSHIEDHSRIFWHITATSCIVAAPCTAGMVVAVAVIVIVIFVGAARRWADIVGNPNLSFHRGDSLPHRGPDI